jgi:hypothetical protein
MARTLALLAGAVTVAAATGLYVLKFETARIETRLHATERAIEKAESDIAVLKAERAYLGRPDRIDTLARRLGLGPATERQYRTLATSPEAAAAAAASDAEALAQARAILMPERPAQGGEP